LRDFRWGSRPSPPLPGKRQVSRDGSRLRVGGMTPPFPRLRGDPSRWPPPAASRRSRAGGDYPLGRVTRPPTEIYRLHRHPMEDALERAPHFLSREVSADDGPQLSRHTAPPTGPLSPRGFAPIIFPAPTISCASQVQKQPHAGRFRGHVCVFHRGAGAIQQAEQEGW
jgi:hypothetical protein